MATTPPTPPPGLTPNELLAWSGAQVKPPENLELPPPEPATEPPSGEPTATNTTQWAVAVTDTDIAFASPPETIEIGSVFLIDSEYMTVNNISNIDNPGVERGTHGSAPAAHEAGVEISIWSEIVGD